MFARNLQPVLSFCRELQQFLLEQDLFWMALMAATFGWIGTFAVRGRPRLRAAGAAVGLVALLIFTGTAISGGYVTLADDLWHVSCRGMVAAAWATSLCWMISPLFAAGQGVCRFLRLVALRAFRSVLSGYRRGREAWGAWRAARLSVSNSGKPQNESSENEKRLNNFAKSCG